MNKKFDDFSKDLNFLLKRICEKEQIFTTLENRMKCGLGKCGHCMVQDKFVCKDGPVFNYLDAKNLED